MDIEIEKLELERKKFLQSKHAHYVDAVYKIFIPLLLVVVSVMTYLFNRETEKTRMDFDMRAKNMELRQKEDEIFLRKNDGIRQLDSLKADFIQKNALLIGSPDPESHTRLRVMAEAIFSKDESDKIMEKISKIEVKFPTTELDKRPSLMSAPNASEYKSRGIDYVRKTEFKSALSMFEIASMLNPEDAEAWNYKAYAEFRLKQANKAYSSISNAINLKPSDKRLRVLVALNATKILCLNGRSNDALTYFNDSVAVNEDLYRVAKDDGELKSICNFNFN